MSRVSIIEQDDNGNVIKESSLRPCDIRYNHFINEKLNSDDIYTFPEIEAKGEFGTYKLKLVHNLTKGNVELLESQVVGNE